MRLCVMMPGVLKLELWTPRQDGDTTYHHANSVAVIDDLGLAVL